jgi:hypothetical protein
MAQIKLDDRDIQFLTQNYPSLIYDEKEVKICGEISFSLRFPDVDGILINDSFAIEISLLVRPGSILPSVRETQGRILKIAERKRMDYKDLHLNNKEGEMCLIIPMKEKERYPNGFDLKIYLENLKKHLYWISYYERYEKEPWKGQGHGEKGIVELYKENSMKYSSAIKEYFEANNGIKYTRQSFRKLMRHLIKSYHV